MVVSTREFTGKRFYESRTIIERGKANKYTARPSELVTLYNVYSKAAGHTPSRVKPRANFIIADTAKASFKVAEVKERVRALSARDVDTAKAELLQRIESLEERLKSLENAIPKERVVILREVSREEAEKEILELFSQGQTLYYSDIAEQLGLDLKLVVETCNELQSRGEIEVVDDTLQRR